MVQIVAPPDGRRDDHEDQKKKKKKYVAPHPPHHPRPPIDISDRPPTTCRDRHHPRNDDDPLLPLPVHVGHNQPGQVGTGFDAPRDSGPNAPPAVDPPPSVDGDRRGGAGDPKTSRPQHERATKARDGSAASHLRWDSYSYSYSCDSLLGENEGSRSRHVRAEMSRGSPGWRQRGRIAGGFRAHRI